MKAEELIVWIGVGTVAVGSVALEPLCRMLSRQPARPKWTDFYRAIPMSLGAALASFLCAVDTVYRMVEENDPGVRDAFAVRVYQALFMMISSSMFLIMFIIYQRSVDPRAEGKGWQCPVYVLSSVPVALVMLAYVAYFVRIR